MHDDSDLLARVVARSPSSSCGRLRCVEVRPQQQARAGRRRERHREGELRVVAARRGACRPAPRRSRTRTRRRNAHLRKPGAAPASPCSSLQREVVRLPARVARRRSRCARARRGTRGAGTGCACRRAHSTAADRAPRCCCERRSAFASFVVDVEALEVLVRIERGHAAGAGRSDGLAIHVIGHVAGREHARHAGRGGVAFDVRSGS